LGRRGDSDVRKVTISIPAAPKTVSKGGWEGIFERRRNVSGISIIFWIVPLSKGFFYSRIPK
jgi:hypothetical protein